MTDRPIYSVSEILAELRREYHMRKRVYARYVAAKSMTQDTAARQLQILDQVIQEYARKPGFDDLFAMRLAAGGVAAEVFRILGVERDSSVETERRAIERIARAMKEGR